MMYRRKVHILSVTVPQFCGRLFAVLLLVCSSIGMQAEVRTVLPSDDLSASLTASKPGDIVLVAGGVYSGGFTVPAGVRLYGGFTAAQLQGGVSDVGALLAQRVTDGEPWKFKHPTILSGDGNTPDNITAPVQMFNGDTRTDNQPHVLTVTGGSSAQEATVIDGLVVCGGNAWTGTDLDGGGIYATGTGHLTVSNCFLYNNAAKNRGGAVYTDEGIRATLFNLMVFNNAGGPAQRSGMYGGGVFLANGLMYNCVVANNLNGGVMMGEKAFVTGCTVARNTMSGVGFSADRVDADQAGLTHTALWGNTSALDNGIPAGLVHSHCAYNGAPASGNNVDLSDNNAEILRSPFFTRPTEKIQYDLDYKPEMTADGFAYPLWDWTIDRTSMLIVDEETGDKQEYPADAFAGKTDLAGKPRYNRKNNADVMDIGAYQFVTARTIVRVDNTTTVSNGKGETWQQPMKDLQAAINYVAGQGGGEVWVKGNGHAHPYRPTTLIYSDQLSTNYLSFIMKDGVSVYGGFQGTENSLQERDMYQLQAGKKFPKDGVTAIPWEYPNETVLQGAAAVDNGADDNIFTLEAGQAADAQPANVPRMVTKALSYHVVWFAPQPADGASADAPVGAFVHQTVLDGVTIKHGNATSPIAGREQRGGGVYMTHNAVLSHCVVTECMAAEGGGAVYLDGGGRVSMCMIHRNGVTNDNAAVVSRGGGVYVKGQGIVMRSMLCNNLADEGGGAFLHATGDYPDNYLILATNVVANNTARINGGAVYMDRGGVLQQSTVAMNYCTADRTLMQGSLYNGETGGVYINRRGVVFNTVLWNNQGKSNKRGLFALDPESGLVKVWAATMAEKNLINWNGIDQKNIFSLHRANTADDVAAAGGSEVYYPNFWNGTGYMPAVPGVYNVTPAEDGGFRQNYYWDVADGSSFRNKGFSWADQPEGLVYNSDIDLGGNVFPIIPDLGAYVAKHASLDVATVTVDGEERKVIYVNPACVDATHNGADWDQAANSLNYAIEVLEKYSKSPEYRGEKLEVWVKEGTLIPSDMPQNVDRRTVSIYMRSGITLRGGFPAMLTTANAGADGGWSRRNPALYHSILDGNIGDKDRLDDNIYHVVTFGENVENAMLDGFHIVNGYAGGEATVLEGGAVLGLAGAHIHLENCILENNASWEANGSGAAIRAADAASLKLVNTVVNNNGHIESDAGGESHEPADYIISVPKGGGDNNVTVNFCTFVNNHVVRVFDNPALTTVTNSLCINSGTDVSFLLENHNTVQDNIETEKLKTTFENPTRNREVTVGFNNYKGGYTSFRPVDRMNSNDLNIVNQGSPEGGVKTDLAQNDRDLGGVPDRGAYEADLPKAGRIVYVRTNGSIDNDGLSWMTPLNSIRAAINKAIDYNKDLASEEYADSTKRAQVWVAAGTYKQDPVNNSSPACFIIEEGVNVYGAFPATGNPGMDERKVLDENYATILEPQNVSTGIVSIRNQDRSGNADIHEQNSYIRRVLAQDNKYNPKRFPRADVSNENEYYWQQGFKVVTEWDGFTLQNGRIDLVNCADDGGAGARLYKNVTLRNCIIQHNYNTASGSRSSIGKPDMRGGGVYSIGGTLINCYIRENHLGTWNSSERQWVNSYGAAYGGGIFCNFSTLYNCVIAENQIHARYADGAGVGMEIGEFYNNTVVRNSVDGGDSRSVGGIRIWVGGTNLNPGHAAIYNTISYGNEGFATEARSGSNGYVFGNADVGVAQGSVDMVNCIIGNRNGVSDPDWNNTWSGKNGEITRIDCTVRDDLALFVDADAGDYRLTGTDGTVNVGANEFVVDRVKVPEPGNADNYRPGNEVLLTLTTSSYASQKIDVNMFEYTDMDYTDRVKDCRVDAGAFEYESAGTTPQVAGDYAYYYVTQNGVGKSDGSSPQTAACATKFQKILNAAGVYKAANPDKKVVVKVAAIPSSVEGGNVTYGGAYRPNNNDEGRLDKDDEQTATFQIPYGIEVWGGYREFADDGTVLDGDAVFADNNRNPYRYKTILSAERVNYTSTPSVYGYHTVTFLEKPEGWTGGDVETVLDGLYLQDGRALSQAGQVGDEVNQNTIGGAAVVPAGAHIRNCVVTGNQAAYMGGGLYLQPGGLVSGTLVYGNLAAQGSGIYATGSDITRDEAERPRIISSTIVCNGDESNNGANLYFGMGTTVLNTVVWGSNNGVNVRGNEDVTFVDGRVCQAMELSSHVSSYPFNNCYVEGSTRLPGNYYNGTMTEKGTTYFLDTEVNDYQLRAYSPLIGEGVSVSAYAKIAEAFNLSEKDLRMQSGQSERYPANTDRKDCVDVGAFAYPAGGLAQAEEVAGVNYKLYVATSDYAASEDAPLEGDMGDLGFSSKTPSHNLRRVFGYIRAARELGADGRFEIFMNGGIYRPKGNELDEFFQVPDGVSIYGGFDFEAVNNGGEYAQDVDVAQALSGREKSDVNGNDIIEPWEFASETILSGLYNTDEKVKKARHVLMALSENNGSPIGVTLDGLSIRNGQAAPTTDEQATDEGLRGGGLYVNNLPLTIRNVSFLENKGGRGAAVYGRGTAAKLVLSGVKISGNEALEIGKDGVDADAYGYGAGVYLAYGAQLEAYNTLWANNEATNGAIIAVNEENAENDGTDIQSSYIHLVNNTVARNKAASQTYAERQLIYCTAAVSVTVHNSILWGNDVTGLYPDNADVQYSGCDMENFADEAKHNIWLNTENNTLTGPYFNSPTQKAGIGGYTQSADWGLRTLSAVVDAGTTSLYTVKGGNVDISLPADNYMYYADGEKTLMKRVSYPSVSTVEEAVRQKWIDMGAYEYQYRGLANENVLYVVAKEAPGANNDGSSWATATANLQGAISQLLNGVGKGNGHRHTKLYIASGEYRPVNNVAGNGFVLAKENVTSAPAVNYNTVTLTVYGSRMVNSGEDAAPQLGVSGGATVLKGGGFVNQRQIMTLAQNTRDIFNGAGGEFPVSIILSDLVFDGENAVPTALSTVRADAENVPDGQKRNTKDDLYLNNCEFRNMSGDAVVMEGDVETGIQRHVVNSLFHHNGAAALSGKAMVVTNATFAENKGLGIELEDGGTCEVRNSVFWNNNNGGEQFSEGIVPVSSKWTGGTGNGALSVQNDDLEKGPNFKNPAEADYRLNPGMQLLNTGDDDVYDAVVAEVSGKTTLAEKDGNAVADPHTFNGQYDLSSTRRRSLDKDGQPTTVDLGAYEYNGMLRHVLYVDNQTSVLNGTGESWTSPMGDVQEALDLAAVAANNDAGQQVGYVFVKGTDRPVASMRLRVGTHVYGSMRGDEVPAPDADEAESVLVQRPGLLEGQTRTVVQQVTSDAITGSYGIVDGVEVTGGTTAPAVNLQGKAMLRNVLIQGNTNPAVRLGDESVLYNALVRANAGVGETVAGTGYVINSTVVDGTLGTPEDKQLNNLVVTGSDIFTKANVRDVNLRYQLGDGATEQLGKGTAVFAELQGVIDFAKDRDILGNNRLFRGKGSGNVDLGCFETWNIVDNTAGATYAVTDTDNNYPHGKSVVYVGRGVELQLNRKDYTSHIFAPAHVLLKHNAGLWAGTYGDLVNKVSLDNVSVERDVQAGGNDLFSVPFTATRIALGNDVRMYAYDGTARAADNKPNVPAGTDSDKTYWVEQQAPYVNVPMQGYLLNNEGTAAVTVRIDAEGTGDEVQPVYTEDGSTSQMVALIQHNSDQWNNGAFTHKENMGWNLFGSPYLHAMNFEDMENGHMLYLLEDGTENFRPVPTYDEASAAVTAGHIPSGDAVFTQTATLEDVENLTIIPRRQPIQPNGASTRLAVYVAPKAAASADRVELTAVAAADAVTEYTPGSDAVKWPALSRNVPQIYARRGGNSYALLSAVSREVDTELGVYVADAGQYELGIPADCNADDYETVVLKDAATGRTVDLKEGVYVFSAAQGGRLEGRFTLSFNRAGSGDVGIRIYGQDGRIVVEGLQPGNLIRVYDTVGRQYTTRVAQNAREELQGVAGHVTLVEVTAKGKTLKTGKVSVK